MFYFPAHFARPADCLALPPHRHIRSVDHEMPSLSAFRENENFMYCCFFRSTWRKYFWERVPVSLWWLRTLRPGVISSAGEDGPLRAEWAVLSAPLAELRRRAREVPVVASLRMGAHYDYNLLLLFAIFQRSHWNLLIISFGMLGVRWTLMCWDVLSSEVRFGNGPHSPVERKDVRGNIV